MGYGYKSSKNITTTSINIDKDTLRFSVFDVFVHVLCQFVDVNLLVMRCKSVSCNNCNIILARVVCIFLKLFVTEHSYVLVSYSVCLLGQ